MLPLCADEGIAVIPWSPLARGRLARAWDETTHRQQTDNIGHAMYDHAAASDRAVVDRVGEIAQRRGVPRAQVALAWVLQKPGVTAPIVGASKPEQMQDALAALSLTLTAEEVAALEAPYVPHRVVGFR